MLKKLSEESKAVLYGVLSLTIMAVIIFSLFAVLLKSSNDENKSKPTIETTSTIELANETTKTESLVNNPFIYIGKTTATESVEYVSSNTVDLDSQSTDTKRTSTSADILPDLPLTEIVENKVEDDEVPSLSGDSELEEKEKEKENKNEEKAKESVINKKEPKKEIKKEEKKVSNSNKPKATPTPVAIQRFAVEIYGADWCAACKSLKAQMDQRGYVEGRDYNYIDIEKESVPSEIRDFMRKNGFIPVVQFSGTIDNGDALRKYYNLK